MYGFILSCGFRAREGEWLGIPKPSLIPESNKTSLYKNGLEETNVINVAQRKGFFPPGKRKKRKYFLPRKRQKNQEIKSFMLKIK